MPKTISGALASHLSQEVTSLASLWRITREDGVEFYFTDHDVNIIFETNTYLSAVGYNRTTVESRVGMAVDNLDVEGFLDSSALTESDLRAGLFDFAEVRVSIVNWEDLSQGALKMRRGRFGEVKYSDDGTFSTELRGLAQAYSQQVIETYQPECRADLGDARCGILLTPPLIARNTSYVVDDEVRVTPLLDDIPVPALHVPADIDENDISSNAANGTLGSEAAHQTSVSKFGAGAIEFTPTAAVDPSNSFLNFSDISAYAIGTGEFTIEGWFRWKSITLPSDVQTIASQYLNTGNQRGWFLRWNGGGGPFLDFVTTNDGSTTDINYQSAAFTPTVGVWYHIAVTRDSSDNVRLFIDGTQSGSTVVDGSTIFNSTTAVRLGKLRSAGGDDQPLNGYIDDFRFVVGHAVYTANFTAPTVAHPSPVAITAGLSTPDYADRTYVCTTAGVTAVGVQPIYNTTPGNTTVDGTAVFTTEEAFTRAGIVSTVTDNRQFTFTFPNGTDSRIELDWFKFGAVTWESGNNLNVFSMEVKDSLLPATTGVLTLDVDDTNTISRAAGSFVDDGFIAGQKITTSGFTDSANNGIFTIQTVTALLLDVVENTLVAESGTGDEVIQYDDQLNLFLAMPFDIEVGDIFSVYAGCDKRLITCIEKFDNILNMRAEPFVPGIDALQQVTRAGEGAVQGAEDEIQVKVEDLVR